MKRRLIASLLSASIFLSLALGIAACSADSGARTTRAKTAGMDDVDATNANGEYTYGEEVYSMDDAEDYGSVEINSDFANTIDLDGSPDITADAKKKMLIYRCTMTIDTLDFENAVSNLKNKVSEYHGFIEKEEQTDGAPYAGAYVVNEEDKSYYYNATIRIPSQYYESFVSSTDGLGMLRSKNSTVDNVTTTYGTLAAELEIYEAEYERYLVKFEEAKDDAIALTIEQELRSLAITIADIKTQMSIIEGDVEYSYVTVTIRQVTEYVEITPSPTPTPTPVDDRFSTEFKTTAKKSWNDCLEFFQGIILFLVRSWWILIIWAIIIFGIIFFVKRMIRRKKIRNEKQRLEREAKEKERIQLMEKARAEEAAKVANGRPGDKAVKKETPKAEPSKPENDKAKHSDPSKADDKAQEQKKDDEKK